MFEVKTKTSLQCQSYQQEQLQKFQILKKTGITQNRQKRFIFILVPKLIIEIGSRFVKKTEQIIKVVLLTILFMLMARLTSSKLNRGNTIIAINPRTVSLVRYSAVILKRIKKIRYTLYKARRMLSFSHSFVGVFPFLVMQQISSFIP